MGDIVRASKFMSLVLRHRPDKIGIALDEHGWVSVNELIAGSQKGGVRLSRALIERVVAENDKKRFVFSEDGSKIRAAQGHSVEVDLELTPQEPPEILYHGTASRSVAAIKVEGLTRGRRHHVHLSKDAETARTVGQRHGKPVILEVQAGAMNRAGVPFYCSDNGVWLVESVPPERLVFPPD